MRRRDLLKLTAAASTMPATFAIGQPTRARTLRFVPQASLTVLDPIYTTAAPTVNHGWAIYDLLFGIDGKFQVQPQMADGYTVSDDERTYLITLREGLKFHNNVPVRAQDCAASLKRWAARETIGQTIGQYVEEWGVKDDKTVRITLKRPVPILINAIARGGASVAFIMPEHIATTDPFKQITDSNGSGPYRFLRNDFVPGAQAAYERFTDYAPRQEPADWMTGGKGAHFDRVEWHVIPDSATAAAALQSGEVDWYEHVQPDLVPLLKRNPDIAFGLANPTGYNGVMRFNHLHPPFNNVNLRRAVMMAVNQTDYLASVTAGDATAYHACKSFFPCGTKFGRELGGEAMQGDLKMAREIVRNSGYNGEKAVLLNPTDLVTVGPFGDVTYDIMKKIGINVEMVATDWGTVVQRRVSREPVEKGGWSVLHTWGPSTIRFTPVEHSQIRGLGPTAWFGWYKDDMIEQLTRDFIFARTDTERDTIADKVQVRAFDQVPSIPLGKFDIRTAYRKTLTGVIEATGPYFWNVRRA